MKKFTIISLIFTVLVSSAWSDEVQVLPGSITAPDGSVILMQCRDPECQTFTPSRVDRDGNRWMLVERIYTRETFAGSLENARTNIHEDHRQFWITARIIESIYNTDYQRQSPGLLGLVAIPVTGAIDLLLVPFRMIRKKALLPYQMNQTRLLEKSLDEEVDLSQRDFESMSSMIAARF